MKVLTALMFGAFACAECSSPTSSKLQLQLLDGTGSTVVRGSIEYAASAQPNTNAGGIAVRLAFRNIGSTDTTLFVVGCSVEIRLYVVPTGGTVAYAQPANRPCTGAVLAFPLAPGKQAAVVLVPYGDDDVARIAPNTYYVRVTPPGVPDLEIAAAMVIRR
jgi:hypothetical protein